MEQKKQNPIQITVRFRKTINHSQLHMLMNEAIKLYNREICDEFEKKSFFAKLFTFPKLYYVNSKLTKYCSKDGKAPMKLLNEILLDPKAFPDAQYETRYRIYIYSSSADFYFAIMPGVAKDRRSRATIRENEFMRTVTIMGNIESNKNRESKQKEFLDRFVPILNNVDRILNGKKD